MNTAQLDTYSQNSCSLWGYNCRFPALLESRLKNRVTLALQSGADPVWVSKQHGHSLAVRMRDYAKWIPGADKGRDLAALNRMFTANRSQI